MRVCGAYQNKLETARKLIARDSSVQDIADLMGLALLQVQDAAGRITPRPPLFTPAQVGYTECGTEE
ncbi:MAG: hypothetical protein IJW57_03830 [Spirochaetaceae bacterium]|nr:hypothetical protein [Spirochaetaceae bacterium]